MVKPPSASHLFKNRLIISPMFKVKASKSTLRTVHCEVQKILLLIYLKHLSNNFLFKLL